MRLTHRLFGLALVALAPAVAIEVYNEVGTRRAREAEVRELARRSALQAASELQQVIEGARHLLTAISQVEAVRTFDPTSCVAYFSQLQPDVPYLLSLAAIDREGWLRCREELPSKPISYADRPYIQKALSTGRFSLGEYTEARIDKIGVIRPALDKPWPITAVRRGAREVTSESCGELKAQAGERLVSTRPGDQRCFIKAPVPVAPQALKNDLWQGRLKEEHHRCPYNPILVGSPLWQEPRPNHKLSG